MNTTNVDILKSFYSVTNRNQLTEEIYKILLKRWELDNIDLNEEMIKINAKQSELSKSKRTAIPEFLKLRSMLDKKKEVEENSISMNDNKDQNDEIITNQIQVEEMAKIN